MRDIISATLGSDHFLKCQTYTIARNGEGLTPCLSISIPKNLSKYWAYIDFKKPNGETFKTPRIDVIEENIEYNIPSAVLDADGKLLLQIVFQNENNEIWKSYVKEFVVRESINATDDIPNKEDFISEAQGILDDVVSTANKLEEKANNGEFDGADYILTDNDKSEIANMVDIEVDQNYNPESKNAQSGIAVAQAIELAIANGVKFRDIANFTLATDAVPIINRDSDGNPFKLVAFRICVKTKIPPTTPSNPLWLRCILEENSDYSSLCTSPTLYSNRPVVVNFYGIHSQSWEVFTDRIYDAAYTSDVRHYKKVDADGVHEFSGRITKIMLGYEWSSALPKGTTIIIQGVDAQ